MANTENLSLEILQLPTWLSRLSADDYVVERLLYNQMTFAAWYRLLGKELGWPREALEIIESERRKKLSMEKALTLLGKMNTAVEGPLDLESARDLLEGYALHDWVCRNTDEFTRLLHELKNAFEEASQALAGRGNSSSKIGDFSKLLGLSPTEEKVLILGIACTGLSDLRTFLELLMRYKKQNMAHLWCTMLACTLDELAFALSSKSVLTKSRLLKNSFDNSTSFPKVSPFWIRLLSEPMTSLFEDLLKPLVPKPGAGIPARLSPEDTEIAKEILKSSKEEGVNLLLYGADGLEKRQMVQDLLISSQKKGFILQESSSLLDTPTLAYVAQRALFNEHGHDAVLVIERPGEVLERRPNEFLRMILGLEVDTAHITPFDELMLSSNPASTIWAGPGTDSLPEECVARFVFHAPLKRARKEERRAQLEKYVQDLKLSKKTQSQLLALEDISALQLSTGLRAAQLAGARTKQEKEQHLVQAVKRSLNALGRKNTPKEKECVTEYSLEYVNCSGKFGPEQVLKALSVRPIGSLCLYGPPGTGKTQFVEHLAKQLGKPLLSKRASDLLSKWVGESEQNIAKMFEEANNDEAILFLDEGDSFLRDRSLAQAGWEVTKVNELLQHMERFEGIFIVATNLFKGLDAAALRRFTFKLEFKALDPDQRWKMFVAETGLKGKLSTLGPKVRDEMWTELGLLPQLTAGDFATVKRQCILLNEVLTPEQWLEQLKIECEARSQAVRDEKGVRQSS